MIGIKERVIEFVVSWSQKSKYFWKSRNHISKIFGQHGVVIINILVAFGFLEKKGNRRDRKYRPVRPIRSDKYNELVSLVGDILTISKEIGMGEAREICSNHNISEFFEPQSVDYIETKDPELRKENELSHYGLLVTQDVTKNYKPVWEVSGETKPVAKILRMCGGIWYPPKQVWSFYRGDPSENLKKVLDDAAKRGYVKSLKVTSAPTEVPTSEVIKRRVNPSKVTSNVIEPIPTEGSSLEKSKDFLEELQKAFLSGETLEKVLRLPDNVKVDVTVHFIKE